MDNFQLERIVGAVTLITIVMLVVCGFVTRKLPDEDIEPHTDSYHKEDKHANS